MVAERHQPIIHQPIIHHLSSAAIENSIRHQAPLISIILRSKRQLHSLDGRKTTKNQVRKSKRMTARAHFCCRLRTRMRLFVAFCVVYLACSLSDSLTPSLSFRTRSDHRRLNVPVWMVTKGDVGSDSLPTDSPRIGTPVLSSRAVALFALAESYQKRGKIALRSLEGSASYQLLDSRDRAFARLLLTTTERRQGQIDQIVDSFVRKTKSRKVSVQQLEPRSATTFELLLI